MKIIRTSTIPTSINTFCKGFLKELQVDEGYEVIVVSSPGESLFEIHVREGVKTYAVPMVRHMAPLKDLKSLWGLIKVFRKEKPNMVHSITPKAGLLSMMAAWICRVPIRLHTFTGLVFPTATGLTKKILMFTDWLTCACATHVVPEGNGVRDDLLNHKITKKRLEVLGYGNIKGVDLEYFNPQSKDVIEKAESIRKSGVFTFIFIGRLVGDKGINELAEAFSRLNKKYHDTRLILVGSREMDLDPLKPETISIIENTPTIEEVGQQSDVRPWLLASDVLAFPSYREGFPNVVIEAGAMGLPSIVTDINGSREIIIEGENGNIIPSKNVEALYEAMKYFVENPAIVKKYSENARPLVASRFEQSFVRQCLKDYYRKISSEKTPIRHSPIA